MLWGGLELESRELILGETPLGSNHAERALYNLLEFSTAYVYTLEYADGTQLIIMGGKFAPARRFTGDPAPDSLADNRESSNFIYKYNGKNMTTERLPNGRVNRITGKLGRPGGLLPLLREWAGNAVHTEQFTKDVQP
jgi:hypothetical protein